LASGLAPKTANDAWIKKLPAILQRGPAGAWLSERDLPAPPAKSFRTQWRERQKNKEDAHDR
ncbi:MAG: hypothetical protein ABI823_20190, partial [Bryobacteraceae bacterium]